MKQNKPKNIKPHNIQGVCHLINKVKGKFTVGDVLTMSCEWPVDIPLFSEVDTFSTYIRWEANSAPYSLVILKTLKFSPRNALFEITSYQPGNYHTGFKLVNQFAEIKIREVKWEVNSVIASQKTKSLKPYPPYGPWFDRSPPWYGVLFGLLLLSLIVFTFFKIRFLIQLKKKKKAVQARLKNKLALSEFIDQLNLLARDINTKKRQQIPSQLKIIFQLFLENQFFILALDTELEKILQQLKKCYPVIYKQCDILDLFYEIQKLSDKQISLADGEWLLNQARDKAILCFQKIQERT